MRVRACACVSLCVCVRVFVRACEFVSVYQCNLVLEDGGRAVDEISAVVLMSPMIASVVVVVVSRFV